MSVIGNDVVRGFARGNGIIPLLSGYNYRYTTAF